MPKTLLAALAATLTVLAATAVSAQSLDTGSTGSLTTREAKVPASVGLQAGGASPELLQFAPASPGLTRELRVRSETSPAPGSGASVAFAVPPGDVRAFSTEHEVSRSSQGVRLAESAGVASASLGMSTVSDRADALRSTERQRLGR